MNSNSLKAQLSGAALGSYVTDLTINADWVSYRHPDYPWTSASLIEQRFNNSGQTAYYVASGDYVGQVEVPNHYERVKCSLAAHTVKVFDLHRFSEDYGYTDKFVQERSAGGWHVCHEVSDFLTSNFGISGLLYQSAAAHADGQFGYCVAIIPGREQQLPSDFFIPAQNS
ncbi:MAG: hypothetical protein HS117_07620 [Verrucomicrobiaceae bacterium]|nr:hypothetical protein [Verrucomicrobiaceae bacterium]